MRSTTSSLFESEMRDQVVAAEAAVLEALDTGDPILIEAARGHLDGLVNLAHRNGLDVTTPIPIAAERDIALEPVVDPPDVIERPAAS
jgi:hypothetical protein